MPDGSAPAPTIVVRPATSADVPAIGRLGALLVQTHHDFDPQRFIAAGERTAEGYGSFLGRQLRESDVIVLVAATADGVRIATPHPGGIFEPTIDLPAERWWPTLPWHTAAEKPIRSTGVSIPDEQERTGST